MTFQVQPLASTVVLAFGHRARHGKDSAAHVITSLYPTAMRFGFADALKAVCRVNYGMTVKDGRLLQIVGTDLYRRRDEDVWLKALYWTIAEQAPPIALITDMRFPNEFDLVKSMGGFCIKVERRLSDGELYVPTDRDPNHVSEIALAGETRWDAVIENPEGQYAVFVDRVLATCRALLLSHSSRGTTNGEAQAA